MADHEPLILAFCCHYCAYAAADLAGSMRLQYPNNVRVLKLPCTGKLEVNFVLAAFERGVDGVIVAGCLEGGCHFLEGNLRARRRVERARELLGEIGLEPERVEMFNLSSAEGPRFAQIVNEMTTRLTLLGPSPLRSACGAEAGVREMTRQAEKMLESDRAGEANDRCQP
ncbi:MAG: heterodisulfide reductase subunit MvhD [Geobacteraceae bacterium GWC2_58_44]|nr:MAG: heterodisulfide reductase subunit MvhD [Geobacteraceae bacterium GWC2_58_44]HBG04872.1 hydrogenase iron-sulfur subunit [Geobacter sp.]